MKEDIIKEIDEKLAEIEPTLPDFYEPTEEELARKIEEQNKRMMEEHDKGLQDIMNKYQNVDFEKLREEAMEYARTHLTPEQLKEAEEQAKQFMINPDQE